MSLSYACTPGRETPQCEAMNLICVMPLAVSRNQRRRDATLNARS